MSPERIWLYLYKCASDVLCDPAKRIEEADKGLAAYLDRFGPGQRFMKAYKKQREKPDDQ